MTDDDATLPPQAGRTPKTIVLELNERCTGAVNFATAGEFESLIGQSYVFLTDLEAWASVLSSQPEAPLLRTASHEYAISWLNSCQGQYRNAFKSLRLVMELCLQSVFLSADLVALGEWLRNESDTIWASLLDGDRALFSKRFCLAFAPPLVEHVSHFREMARTVYRELSECIHGNVPEKIPLPLSIGFDEATFRLWHEKAKIVRLASVFSLSMRYLGTLTPDERKRVEGGVIDQLGHIEAVRDLFSSGDQP
jgi:hypothetical protein